MLRDSCEAWVSMEGHLLGASLVSIVHCMDIFSSRVALFREEDKVLCCSMVWCLGQRRGPRKSDVRIGDINSIWCRHGGGVDKLQSNVWSRRWCQAPQ